MKTTRSEIMFVWLQFTEDDNLRTEIFQIFGIMCAIFDDDVEEARCGEEECGNVSVGF